MLVGASAATAVPVLPGPVEPALPAALLPGTALLRTAPLVTPLVVALPDAADARPPLDPELADPALVALGPDVPAEPAVGVREEEEPLGAADEFGEALAALVLLGVRGAAGDEALDDGFGAGVEVAVGLGDGFTAPPELIAGGLIPGWAPLPKLKPTAVPGLGSQPATPTWL